MVVVGLEGPEGKIGIAVAAHSGNLAEEDALVDSSAGTEGLDADIPCPAVAVGMKDTDQAAGDAGRSWEVGMERHPVVGVAAEEGMVIVFAVDDGRPLAVGMNRAVEVADERLDLAGRGLDPAGDIVDIVGAGHTVPAAAGTVLQGDIDYSPEADPVRKVADTTWFLSLSNQRRLRMETVVNDDDEVRLRKWGCATLSI